MTGQACASGPQRAHPSQTHEGDDAGGTAVAIRGIHAGVITLLYCASHPGAGPHNWGDLVILSTGHIWYGLTDHRVNAGNAEYPALGRALHRCRGGGPSGRGLLQQRRDTNRATRHWRKGVTGRKAYRPFSLSNPPPSRLEILSRPDPWPAAIAWRTYGTSSHLSPTDCIAHSVLASNTAPTLRRYQRQHLVPAQDMLFACSLAQIFGHGMSPNCLPPPPSWLDSNWRDGYS